MLILKVLNRILSHPLNRRNKLAAFSRFVKWQVSTRLTPYPVLFPFTDRTRLIVQKGLTGATGNLYCGLDEFHDMAFLLHFLRSPDLFVDVGANIGSYTILASGHVGSKSISVEPNLRSFEFLMKNLWLNNIAGKVTPLNIGLGSKAGMVRFTNNRDTVNHVADENDPDVVDIQLDTLDEVLGEMEPVLIKIDVEGYEHEVMRGAEGALQKRSLKAIIIELVNHGKRYGFSDEVLHNELISLGFESCSYDPFLRTLSKKTGFDSQNTLYVRDYDFVLSRVKAAAPVFINHIKV